MEDSNMLLLNVLVVEPASSSVLPDPVLFVRAGVPEVILATAGIEVLGRSTIGRSA
jgi:hypothetical protein